MLDQRIRHFHRGVGRALLRISEERRSDRRINRPALEGRDAAIGNALIVKVFDAHRRYPCRLRPHGQRRIDAVALERDVVAIAVRVLVHAVDAKGDVLVNRLGPKSTATRLLLFEPPCSVESAGPAIPHGLFAHAIDQAADAAATEHHAIRSFQHFDADRCCRGRGSTARRRACRRERNRQSSCCRG